eukprot:2962841-Amphidinium_carterae.1
MLLFDEGLAAPVRRAPLEKEWFVGPQLELYNGAEPAPGEADVAGEPADEDPSRIRAPSPMANLRPTELAKPQPTSQQLAQKRLGITSPRS